MKSVACMGCAERRAWLMARARNLKDKGLSHRERVSQRVEKIKNSKTKKL